MLRALDAALVVADIPPLALAAARLAGVPAIALGNFTWDWIYRDYPGGEAAADAHRRGLSTRRPRVPAAALPAASTPSPT